MPPEILRSRKRDREQDEDVINIDDFETDDEDDDVIITKHLVRSFGYTAPFMIN